MVLSCKISNKFIFLYSENKIRSQSIFISVLEKLCYIISCNLHSAAQRKTSIFMYTVTFTDIDYRQPAASIYANLCDMICNKICVMYIHECNTKDVFLNVCNVYS